MHRDSERQKLFSRRLMFLAGGKAVLLSLLFGRLYYLQVIEAERYTTLAEDNRINLRLLPPPRGRILDRLGRPIAVNQQNYRVELVAEQAGDPERTLRRLGEIIPVSEGDLRRTLREIGRKRPFVPVTVRENLDWDQVANVEVNALDLPGVAIDEGQSRLYPYGESLAHVLGYVAPPAESELTGDPLLELPGFRVGKSGVEKTYDLHLRGVGGSSQVEVNAYGRVIRELERREGRAGADLTLSIDLDLQLLASRRLEGQSGAVVLMDVFSGEILALASEPGFDPNAFSRGLSGPEWRRLTADSKAPLTNKAIAGQYAPGSTYKPVVALAGLEKGAITPETRISCSGKIHLGDLALHCWRRGGHGSLDLRAAIAQSCDVYFYEVARRCGVDHLAVMANRFGMGHTLGIDLPGERGGLIPTREWKKAARGDVWHAGETLISGIGQGYVLATPLQLAVMTARIANGGFAVVPTLRAKGWGGGGPGVVDPGTAGKPRPPATDVIVNPAHLKVVREGMVAVVNSGWGTARAAAIREPGMEMAGKSGTSQVRRISRAERQSGVIKNEDLPWERRDHALFVAYAPIGSPRFACAVVIEHGGGGSKVAAPIARDVLLAAQQLERSRAPSAAAVVPGRERAEGPETRKVLIG
jgi:penicillin-binding protein 2